MRPNSLLKACATPALLVASLLLFVSGLTAQTRFAYIPSTSTNDPRFLSITGSGVQTLGDQVLTFKISAPAGSANFQLGIFDGETGGMWDIGTQPLQFTLFADPNSDATGTYQVAQWMGNTMPDNAWFNATVNNVSQARAATGDFFYVLRVRSLDYGAYFWSNFKIRVSGSVTALRLTNIAYSAPLCTLGDARIIYPQYPTLSPTTYDGVWNFYVSVPTPQTSLVVWDGDMDHGTYDCSDNDTDDPDTPNTIPPFATGAAVRPEGIGNFGGVPCINAAGNVVAGLTTSNPPDDSQNPVYRRTPSINYEVISPNGVHYANNNPSGNLEWEQFMISTAPFNRATMDYHADSLPAGVYQIRVTGVDLTNLNAIRSPFEILAVDSVGTPIPMPTPYQISGTIFEDRDGNGIQAPGELGIPGAIVTLNGVSDTTGTDGRYSFIALQPGANTVRVKMPAIICNNNGGDDDGDHHNGGCNGGDRDNNNHNGCNNNDRDNNNNRNGCNNNDRDNNNNRNGCNGGDHHGDDDNNHNGCNGGDHHGDDDNNNDCGTWQPTYDLDGIATPNVATVTLSLQNSNPVLKFGYRKVGGDNGDDEDDDDGDGNHHHHNGGGDDDDHNHCFH